MKIRNGFVSNSSTTSFILIFKEIPKSIAELEKILDLDPYIYNTKVIAGYIFSRIYWAKVNDYKEFEYETEIRAFNLCEFGDEWGKVNKDPEEFKKELLEDHKAEVGNDKFVILDFENHSGMERFCSLGEPFQNMRHISINHC